MAVILPGIVFCTVLQRLRGPTPEDRDVGTRVLRATAIGVGLDLLYLAVGGTTITRLLHEAASTHTDGVFASPRTTALWTLLLVGAIPTSLALLVHTCSAYREAPPDWSVIQRLKRVSRTTYRTTPTAWDHIARKRGGCFIRVRLSDGEYLGGWVGPHAYVSGYPEPRDLFIDSQWALDPEGRFLHRINGSLGCYVSLGEGVLVEWIEVPNPNPSGTTPSIPQGAA